jgi:hypothetical protein
MKTPIQFSKKTSITTLLILIYVITIKAQIVYTNLNPDSSFTIVKSYDGNRIPIDFNGDGTAEVKFRYDKYGTSVFLHVYRGNNNTSPKIMLKGTATNSSGVPWIDPLTKNTDINSTKNWGYNVYGPLLGDFQDSNFLNIGERYIGVKFIFSGKVYYGWILVSYTTLKLTVKEFAYESTANKAIKAGDKGTNSINSTKRKNRFTLYPNPASKSIYVNLNTSVNISKIKIYSILGEEVIEINIYNRKRLKIDVSKLKKGVYYISIMNKDNIIENKKLIING